MTDSKVNPMRDGREKEVRMSGKEMRTEEIVIAEKMR
jgi:hypothetical protein